MGSRNLSFKKIIFSIEDEQKEIFDLIIDAKNSQISKQIVKMKFNFFFTNLKKYFSKKYNFEEIFFTIANKIDGKNFRNLYKSEEIKERENYNFSEFIIAKELLCETDNDEILIRVYDKNIFEFGSILTNLTNIRENKNNNVLEISEKQIIGILKFACKYDTSKTFVDYLAGGMQINLVIGIDFTASNGGPSEPNSLHCFNTKEPNFYERAIQACGSILSYYDYDKIFPVFGFGAQFHGSNVVNHCFNINFSQDPNIYGLNNVISTYREVVYKLNFSGPTYFTPLIRNVINIIRYNLNNSKDDVYYILMILTDGQINDMTQTCDAIVEAALLPLSIIIIGIGEADFTNMNILGKIFKYHNNYKMVMRFLL